MLQFNCRVDFTDIRVGRIAHAEGVSFVLETGHENNPEAEKVFNDVRRLYGDAAAALRSICFVPKESCRAIQMADLFAFYSRRHGVETYLASPAEKQRLIHEPGVMLNIISEGVPHRAYVATILALMLPVLAFSAAPWKASEGLS